MSPDIKTYLNLSANRNFLVLVATIFVGQIASAFLLLFLITEVFAKTGSNFGVSGVILSLSVPALLLMTIAGFVSDLFDRRKIIITTNIFITLVVMAAILFRESVVLLITLSFLYFAGNSFFFPAITATTGQLLKKKELMHGNSLFFMVLAGGQVFGLFLAAVVQFFFENIWSLVICESLLVVAAILPFFLPRLLPRRNALISVFSTLLDIFRFFRYLFRAKTIWFYFFMFASCQGIVSFGGTIAPGFFDRVVGLTVEQSPLLIFPTTGLGLILGAIFSHFKIRESFMVILGFFVLGLGTALLGFFAGKTNIQLNLILGSGLFLIGAGFSVIVIMIASRTIIQKRVEHRYQGSLFGTNFVLSSLIASIASPSAAALVAFLGYANVLLAGGLTFISIAILISVIRRRWAF